MHMDKNTTDANLFEVVSDGAMAFLDVNGSC